ncbi:hypothetical protein L5B97_11450 [Avibacterium sp. 20-15]|uniref:hypothetical protein n=1 Tax=unclassified Avibacterium TaxID=2685287 RepID=UPI0020265466|nr:MULTISPECIES: hypothetical protein [unclassified Avibacterium]MCW9734071.1 hypothetical protein [Avibacterium sp. 20-15]URL01358.1 hypothetical protein L4F91_07380 [Avibacterium sp. 20-126]URL03718.1 hypothetical protein L4F93_09105 [Avibacterium sp. 20-132]
MKRLILLFLANSAIGETNNIITKEEYIQDAELYHQFLDLGESLCIDKIYHLQTEDKTNKYSFFKKHSQTLNGLNSKFDYYYKWSDIKIILNKYYNENINNTIKKYKLKDEYFKLEYSSPTFICKDLFTDNKKLKKLYKDFIYKYNLSDLK